jgi:hypothetical protein
MILRWKIEALWRAGQARRICFSPVFNLLQLATQEQLHARNFPYWLRQYELVRRKILWENGQKL